jgi:hypothetical protein
MSLVGKPNYETLRERVYRARLLREDDPAAFYLRRHKRKLRRRVVDTRITDQFLSSLIVDWDLTL